MNDKHLYRYFDGAINETETTKGNFKTIAFYVLVLIAGILIYKHLKK